MGAGSVNSAYLGTGQLAYGCSNLAAAWPHGGTGLGIVSNARLVWRQQYVPVTVEDFACPLDVLFVGGQVAFGCYLENWDTDALTQCFPSGTTTSSDRVIDVPGNDTIPGAMVSTLTSLVYTPRNSDHPAVLIHRAAPMIETAQEINWSAYRWLHVAVTFMGTPDTSDRVAQIGKLSRLVL